MYLSLVTLPAVNSSPRAIEPAIVSYRPCLIISGGDQGRSGRQIMEILNQALILRLTTMLCGQVRTRCDP
jgi:hypothetical protein